MSWNTNTHTSDHEMHSLSSSAIRDDNVHVRLLSMSEDEDDDRMYTDDIPSLTLRNERSRMSRPMNEKKSRCAAISVLVIGLCLILAINIGVAMKLKHDDVHIFSKPTAKPSTATHCDVKKSANPVKCDDAFPYKHYRLPDTIHPELYTIFLWPNLATGTFNGSVNISMTALNATSMIVLHSKKLKWSKFTISKNGAETQPKAVKFCPQLDLVAVLLTEQLHVGEKALLHVEFEGNMLNALRGFYMSKYSTQSGENLTLGTTQFESIDARKSFPCFDEPSFKAKFSLSIVRQREYNAISNMPIAKTEDFLDGLKIDHFKTTLTMSTYLLAFIVSEFDHISRVIPIRDGDLKVSVYAAQDRITRAEYALNVSCDVIQFYEKLFNISYPLPKLDLVAIPDFEAGAMENWGLVTYRQTAVLLNEQSPSTSEKEYVALVIAHELAHQWFGDLVTMKWWNDLWLNEGFASFMEYYAIHKIYPDWDYMSGFNREHSWQAMATDESKYTHPISVHVDSATEIESLFDSISYSKGACIINMMTDYLGADSFMRGVSNYLNKFSFGNAETIDLIDAVSAEAKGNRINIPVLLKSWTSQPGFPVVNVSLNGNVVSLSQMRYIVTKDSEKSEKCGEGDKDLIWQIPISYSSNLDLSKNWYNLETKSGTLTLDKVPEWVVINIDRGGYYLANYDEDLLSTITKQMQMKHQVFSKLSREGIIFSVLKSAKIGLTSYDDVFNLISYAKTEEDYGPLRLVGDFILSIAHQLRNQFQSEALSKIEYYGQNLFMSLYQRYGWPEMNKTISGLSHAQIKLRKYVVSAMCELNLENCTAEAKLRFDLWRKGNIQLNPDYKGTVYGLGIKLGSNDDWDFLWKKFTTDKTIDVHEIRRLLTAICLTGNQGKMLYLLSESMKDETIRMQDLGSVLGSLQSNQAGGLLTWKFIRNKWSEIVSHFPLGSSVSRRFLNIFNSFSDDADIAAGEEFMLENNLTDIRFAKRKLDQAKFNVHWINTALPQIVNWLNENVHNT